MILKTLSELDALYPPASKRALAKVQSSLNADHVRFLARSPFYAVATSGAEGLDCSPRGDPPGNVAVLSPTQIALPNRPGNRRHDSLKNLLLAPRIALLFFIPGIGETLRINGRAELHLDATLSARFEEQGHTPKVVLVIHIEQVYHHCSKAFMRSKIWDLSSHEAGFERISKTDPESYRHTLYQEPPKD